MTEKLLRFIAAVVLGSAGATMMGQASARPALAFDVSTIKPSDPDKTGGELMMSRGGFDTRNQTLLDLIKFAYSLNMGTDQQVSGGPKWLGSARFDLDAKEDEATIAALKQMGRDKSTEQVRLMVQGLLAERFGLRVHHETRSLPVYAIVLAKGGSKMTISADAVADGGEKKPENWSGIKGAGRGSIEGRNVTMALFTNFLARNPELGGRMVIDNSSLQGKYNFTLKWTPDPGAGGAAPADSAAPGLFTALQEQLGLRLDSTHAPIDTIVVDSAEMPSAN